MTKLLVRRASFPFGDGVLERGQAIDTADYPSIDQHKWDQLVEHRYFDWQDRPDLRKTSRASAEQERARQEFAPSAEPDAPETGVGCPSCDFVAKTPHGLLVHTGRKHRAS